MSSLVSIPRSIVSGSSTPQEWTLLATKFEQQHGKVHPSFLASRFMDALQKSKDQKKFLFMYIHSPDHPFTPSFCKETLCSEFVVEFLDFNFVCWGALHNKGEGQEMVTALKVTDFPFCAVVATAPNAADQMAVIQQMEGPVSPADLVDILLRSKEEQGKAFGIEEQQPIIIEPPMVPRDAAYYAAIERERKIREEQDAAYFEALKQDQEKELQERGSTSLRDRPQEVEKAKANDVERQPDLLKLAPSVEAPPQGRYAGEEVTPQGKYARGETVQDKEIHKSEPSLPDKAKEKEKAKGKGLFGLFKSTSAQRTSQGKDTQPTSKGKDAQPASKARGNDSEGKDTQRTSKGKVTEGEPIQILIRFPNGERREQSFMSTDKIEEIYKYIDSQELSEVGNYRLVSSFPRNVYGVDEMGISLKEAGLQQKASLLLERLTN